MATYGDDATLMKVAIFGLAMSIICTMGIQIMFVETGDYDYEDIQAYRNELISFSGETMINNNPWVLVSVMTPWNPSLDPSTHYEDGWLYGEKMDSADEYADIGKSADIHMDPDQKSTVPLTFTRERASYEAQTGTEWWANIPVISWIGTSIGLDPYTYSTVIANNWDFTGYRYVFDPTLPIGVNEGQTSIKDGSLSLVWYTFNGQEGLSGGLDIYGGETLLASYTAADIVAEYNDSSSYASVYDFDFSGTHLNLSIRFDPQIIENGTPLMQAWSEGSWSLAISSVSAGNFLDLEGSAAYSTTMGGMLDTFIKIYTFNLPDFGSEWAAMVLWLMVGLPMTIALLCVTMRVISAIKPL